MSLVASVQKHTLTLPADTLEARASITGVSSIAKCVPFWTKRVTAVPLFHEPDEYCVDVYIDTGTDEVVAARGAGDNAAVVVEVSVVEFGADATVQTGIFTLAEAVGTVTASPTVSVAQLTKSFVLHSWTYDTVGENYKAAVSAVLTENTVTFERGLPTTGACSGHWYVVTDTASHFTVQRFAVDMNGGAGTDTLADQAITTVAANKAMVIANWHYDASGKDPEDMPYCYLLDNSTVRCQRLAGSGDAWVKFEVVEFSGNENVQGGLREQTVQTASDAITITLAAGDVADSVAIGNFSSFAQGSCNSNQTDFLGECMPAFTLSTNTLTITRYTGAAGPTIFRYPWQVVTWDVGGAPPVTPRRVMVIT